MTYDDSIMPPIAPGQKIKIEVYNTGHELITTVTYPDKDYSLCTCTAYLVLIAATLAAIYYYIKSYLTRKGEPKKESSDTKEQSEPIEQSPTTSERVLTTETPVPSQTAVENDENADDNVKSIEETGSSTQMKSEAAVSKTENAGTQEDEPESEEMRKLVNPLDPQLISLKGDSDEEQDRSDEERDSDEEGNMNDSDEKEKKD